jgi:tRNA (guanine-N7-)-methyltransferase
LIAEKIPVEYGDAAEIIEKFDDNKISQIYMLFPDPWQKVKHRKRRLFSEYTFRIIDRILKRDGFFHFASDNINYAFQAKRIIEKASCRDVEFSKHRGFRPVTRYEVKGIRKRKFIFDLIYFKN